MPYLWTSSPLTAADAVPLLVLDPSLCISQKPCASIQISRNLLLKTSAFVSDLAKLLRGKSTHGQHMVSLFWCDTFVMFWHAQNAAGSSRTPTPRIEFTSQEVCDVDSPGVSGVTTVSPGVSDGQCVTYDTANLNLTDMTTTTSTHNNETLTAVAGDDTPALSGWPDMKDNLLMNNADSGNQPG